MPDVFPFAFHICRASMPDLPLPVGWFAPMPPKGEEDDADDEDDV